MMEVKTLSAKESLEAAKLFKSVNMQLAARLLASQGFPLSVALNFLVRA